MDDLTANCYAILGLTEGASKDEVGSAFRRLKEEFGGSRPDWERLKEVTWAYETLMEREAAASGEQDAVEDPAAAAVGTGEFNLIEFLFPPQFKVNLFYFLGRCLVFVLFFIAGVRLMIHLPSSELAGQSFFHNVSLPFHEAGHIIFSFLGDFMRVLGGSLMQVLVPVICLIAFLKRNDVFAASVALWWTGQNFIDMAPYINDARAQQLMLLGGVTGQDVPGYHDWNNILGRLGMLRFDHAIANMSHFFGTALMIAAFIWGGIVLYMQYRNLDR
ncbi:MAG TPA: hypothetical protein PLR60_15500 [Syntrophorhabdaceae bacterium]|nr:hypothetical protein [Syntrophorhabdaceae bacterium]